MKYKTRDLTLKKREFLQDQIIDYLAGRTSKKEIKIKYEKRFNVTDNSFFSTWNYITVDYFYINFKTKKTDFNLKEDNLRGLGEMEKNYQLLKYKDDLTIKDIK